jgi:hypothetical protein
MKNSRNTTFFLIFSLSSFCKAHALEIDSDDFDNYVRGQCSSGPHERQCLTEATKVRELLVNYAKQKASATGQKPKATGSDAISRSESKESAKKSDALSIAINKILPPDGNTRFVLAKSFADLGVLGTFDPKKTTGATISYSNDRISKNSSWTIQGVGTIGHRIIDHDTAIPPLYYMQFGIYGGVNKITNSNIALVNKSVDNVIYGGFSEMQLKTSDHSLFHHWVRLTAGATTNNISTRNLLTVGKTTFSTTQAATQLAVSGEYLPVWDLYPHVPAPLARIVGGYITPLGEDGPMFRFQPSALFQYNNTFDSTNVLTFSGKKYSARFGPQVNVVVYPIPNPELFGLDNLGLNGLFIQTVYHWYHELAGPRINYIAKLNNLSVNVYSGRNNYVFDTSLNYPITKSIRLTGSYQRGVDENAGKNVNVFLVGLSGQLCGGYGCQ